MNQKLDEASAPVGSIRSCENMRYQKQGRVDAVGPYMPWLRDHVYNSVAVSQDDSSNCYIFQDNPNKKCTIVKRKRDGSEEIVQVPPTKDLFWRATATEVEREVSGIYQSHYAESDRFEVVSWVVQSQASIGLGTRNAFNRTLKYRVREYELNRRTKKRERLIRTYHGTVLNAIHGMCVAGENRWAIVALQLRRFGFDLIKISDSQAPENQNSLPDFDYIFDRSSSVIRASIADIQFPFDGGAPNSERDYKLFDMLIDNNDLYFVHLNRAPLRGVPYFRRQELKFYKIDNILSSNSSVHDETRVLPAPYNEETNFNRPRPDNSIETVHSITMFRYNRIGVGYLYVSVVGTRERLYNLGDIADLPDVIDPTKTTRNDILSNKVITSIDVPQELQETDLAKYTSFHLQPQIPVSITSFPPTKNNDVNFIFCGDNVIQINWDGENDIPFVNDSFVYMHEVNEDTNLELVAQGSYKAKTIRGHFFASNFGVNALPEYNSSIFNISENNLTIPGTQGPLNIKLGLPNTVESEDAEHGSQFVMRAMYSDIVGSLIEDHYSIFNDKNTLAVFQERKSNGDTNGLYVYAARIRVDRTTEEEEDASAPSVKLPRVDRQAPVFTSEDFFENVMDVTYCSFDKSFYIVTCNISPRDYHKSDENFHSQLSNSILRLRVKDGAWGIERVKTFTGGRVQSIVYSSKIDPRSLLLKVGERVDGTYRSRIQAVDLKEYELTDRGLFTNDLLALTTGPSEKIVGFKLNFDYYSIIKTREVEHPALTLSRTAFTPPRRGGAGPITRSDIPLEWTQIIPTPTPPLDSDGVYIDAPQYAPIYGNNTGDIKDPAIQFNCGTCVFNDNEDAGGGFHETYMLTCASRFLKKSPTGQDRIFIGKYKFDDSSPPGGRYFHKPYLSELTMGDNMSFVSSRDIMGGGDNPLRVAAHGDRTYQSRDSYIPKDFATLNNFYESSILGAAVLGLVGPRLEEFATRETPARFTINGIDTAFNTGNIRDTFFTDIALDQRRPTPSVANLESSNATTAFFLSPLNLKIYYVDIDTRRDVGLSGTVASNDYEAKSIDISGDFGNLLNGNRYLPACITVDEVNRILYVYGFEYTNDLPATVPSNAPFGSLALNRDFRTLPQWFQDKYTKGFRAGNIPVFPRKVNGNAKVVAYSIRPGTSFGGRDPSSDIDAINNAFCRMEYDSQGERFWFRWMVESKTKQDLGVQFSSYNRDGTGVRYFNNILLQNTVNVLNNFVSSNFSLGYKSNNNQSLYSTQLVIPGVDSELSNQRFTVDLDGGYTRQNLFAAIDCNYVYASYTETISEEFTYDTADFYEVGTKQLDQTLFEDYAPNFMFYRFSNNTLSLRVNKALQPTPYLTSPQLDPDAEFKRVEYGRAFYFLDPVTNLTQIVYNKTEYIPNELENIKLPSILSTTIAGVIDSRSIQINKHNASLIDGFRYTGQGRGQQGEQHWLASAGERVSGYFLLDKSFDVVAKFNYGYNVPDTEIVPNTKVAKYMYDGKESLRICSPRAISAGEVNDSKIHSIMRYTSLDNNPNKMQEQLPQQFLDPQVNPIKKIGVAYNDGLHYIAETPLLVFDGRQLVNHGFALNPSFSFIRSTEEKYYLDNHYYAQHGRLRISNPFTESDRYRYSYLAIQKWMDAQGMEHTSGVSLIGKVLSYPIGDTVNVLTETGDQLNPAIEETNSIELRVSGSSFEDKNYFIELYRTEAAGQIYRLLRTFVSDTANIVDDKKDEDLVKEATKTFDPSYDLATENFQPSNVVGIRIFSNNAMIWGLPENPNAVWVSRRFNRAQRRPLEFVSAQFHEFPSRVIDVRNLNNYAIIMTETKAFSLSADNFLRENPREIQCPSENLPLERALTVHTEDGLIWFTNQFLSTNT